MRYNFVYDHIICSVRMDELITPAGNFFSLFVMLEIVIDQIKALFLAMEPYKMNPFGKDSIHPQNIPCNQKTAASQGNPSAI